MGKSIDKSDVGMKLVLNEVSFNPFAKDSIELFKLVNSVLENFSTLKEKYGFDHIISPSELGNCLVLQDQTFMSWFIGLSTPQKNKIQPLLLRKPFSDEVLEDNLSETDRYYLEHVELNISEYCKGLATSYIFGIPSLSICTHEIWDRFKLFFKRFSDDVSQSEVVSVLNVSCSDISLNQELIEYCESNYEPELLHSNLTPDEKPIRLSGDHHGNNKLESFAKRIVLSSYVDGIINNLPFHPYTSRFIRNVHSNGIVEITMHWEDEGYGMAIQTTGRNQRETEEIAKILRDKFDK